MGRRRGAAEEIRQQRATKLRERTRGAALQRRQAADSEWLPIDDIFISRDIQVRVGDLHAETVNTYTEVLKNGGEFPPIDVFDIDGQFYVADGFHRLEAHLRAERSQILAVVHSGNFEDAIEYAEEGNLKHGRPLSQKDKAALFERRVLRGHVWTEGDSFRAIGKSLGLSHQTISRWWSEVARANPKNEHVQRGFRVQGIDGQTQSTKGKRKQELSDDEKRARRMIHSLRNAASNLKHLERVIDSEELNQWADVFGDLAGEDNEFQHQQMALWHLRWAVDRFRSVGLDDDADQIKELHDEFAEYFDAASIEDDAASGPHGPPEGE